MCLTCGCGRPNDDHGNSRNITMGDLNEAAPSLGQESGTDWQESQQMGYTGRGGVQKPNESE